MDEQSKSIKPKLSKQRLLILLTVAITALIAGYFLSSKLTGFIETTSTPTVEVALVVLLVKVLTYVIAPLGGAGLKLLSGSVFGWEIATLIIVIGDTIGSALNYYLGKLGIKFVQKKQLSSKGATLGRFDLNKTSNLILARFVLSPAWDLISYALGAKRVGFRKFMLASTVGGIPASILWALAGTSIATMLGRTSAAWLSLILLISGTVLALVYAAIKRRH